VAVVGSRPAFHHEGRPPRRRLSAGIGTHAHVFQTMVLDPESGELTESRFQLSRERLGDWSTHGHLLVRRATFSPHPERTAASRRSVRSWCRR
jgi:hypothetical protein